MMNSSSSASTNQCTVPSSRWRRSVTFSNTSVLILINKQQLSSDTKKSLYCTEEDIATFKRNTHLCARLVQESIARGIVPPIESIIGNEKFLTPHIANQYVARRNKLKRSVLKVSRWQEANRKPTTRSRDYADMDFLACVSSKHSAWARKKAKTAALVLQRDLEEERRHEERMFQACQDYNYTMCMPASASSSSSSSAHQDITGHLQTIPEEHHGGRRVSVSPVMDMEIDGTLSRIRI